MHRYQTASAKLDELLGSLWTSPVFGDSFRQPLTGEIVATIDQIYLRCTATLLDLIAQARPDLSGPKRLALVDQVASKSVAFCGALGADMSTDAERLSATAVAIALVYLCDQTMDRGDLAMNWVIERVGGDCQPHTDDLDGDPRRARYLGLIGALVQQVTVLARPEDRCELLRCLIDDTLVREARVARLNQLYLEEPPESFWPHYADEFAELSAMNVGLIGVSAMVYSVLRHSWPALPPVAAILPGAPPVAAALRAASAACRIYDDVGDRAIDQGGSMWGVFAINPCNQRDPRLLSATLDAMGMHDEGQRRRMLDAFAGEAYGEVIELTSAFARDQYAAIPPTLWAYCGPFLQLSQRVLEAGRVNINGDDQLADVPLDQRTLGSSMATRAA